MQSHSLDQLKSLKEQIRNSLSASTPRPYRNRAQALLQSIDNFMRYNSKGEIYTKDQDLVPGSRVEDLINYAVRDRRRNIVPEAWSTFLNYLREHNIPKTILNRSTLDELEGISTTKIKQRIKPTVKVKLEPTSKSHQSKLPQRRVIKKRSREVSPPTKRSRIAKKEALDFLKTYKA